MKGFIEVQTVDNKALLINTNVIEAVEDKKIFVIGSEEWWSVRETYEQLVCKIRMAVGE